MCQIIQGPSAKLKSVLLNTPGLLEQLHENNPDGWGALYHTKAGPKAIKKLPRNAADTRKLIEKLPSDDRDVALHWRWKTSGLVDQENAHPHFVEGGWLIHNGVLDIDMSANPDRCDTHHFARAYLDGSMTHIVNSPKMLDLLGEFIGNNRFVLMDDAGTMALVNAHQGYTAQGLWFANTYSMSRHFVDPTHPKPRPFVQGGTGKGWVNPYKDWWSEDEGMDGMHPLDRGATGSITYDVAEDADAAIEDYNTEEMTALLEEFPLETLRHLFVTYDVSVYRLADDNDLTPAAIKVRQMLIDNDLRGLMDALEDDLAGVVADRIASTLLYFCTVDYKVEAFS